MIWFRRSGHARPHTGVTPADAADLEAAKAARARVERQIQSGRLRWPTVLEIKGYLRRVHEENHLADDLKLIFGDRRG